MIPIENEKRVDWNAIRAEYIAGGISQRKLAKKYGIAVDTLLRRANREGWAAHREEVYNETATVVQQKTAEAAADNATLAQDFRKRLLMRLMRIEAKYPFDATEVRTKQKDNTVIFRIRDLTAAFKDITEGLTLTEDAGNELLQSLIEMERRAGM